MYLLGLGILLKLIHFILGVSFELIGSKSGNMRVEVFFGNNLGESLIPLRKKRCFISKKDIFARRELPTAIEQEYMVGFMTKERIISKFESILKKSTLSLPSVSLFNLEI